MMPLPRARKLTEVSENLEDLSGLLVSSQTKQIPLPTNIEKTFVQPGSSELERDITRLLWIKKIKKPPINTNLQVCAFARLCLVSFRSFSEVL